MISPNDQSSLPEQCQLASRPVCLYKCSSDHISPDCFRNRTMSEIGFSAIANIWRPFGNPKDCGPDPLIPADQVKVSPLRASLADRLIVNAIGLLSDGQPLQASALSIRCAVPAEWSNAVALNAAPKAPPQLRGSGMSGKVALSPAREDLCRRNEVFCPASHAAVC